MCKGITFVSCSIVVFGVYMDSIVRVHHGGTITFNDNGVEFAVMELSVLVYGTRPSFGKLVESVKDELGRTEHGVGVRFEGIYDVGVVA